MACGIPLGAAFWDGYWDADYHLIGSPPSYWRSRVDADAMSPGNAPTIGTLGGRTAIVCAKASTQYMRETGVAPLASGDDTPFTLAWHASHATMTSSDTILAIASTADAVHYARVRIAASATACTLALRDGGAGETVGASTATLPAAGTPYTGVLVRHGDTYSIYIDGSLIVDGATCAAATLGDVHTLSFGALYRSTGAGLAGAVTLRRVAFAADASITAAQVLALHTAWIGR